MSHEEKFRGIKSTNPEMHSEVTPVADKKELTPVQKVFAEMSEAYQKEYLTRMQGKYTPEQLIQMYGISPEDSVRYFPFAFPAPQKTEKTKVEKRSEIEVEPEFAVEPVTLTHENTHVVVLDDITYPQTQTGEIRKRLPVETATLLQSISSVAEHQNKPYAQVVFANGTRIFQYTKRPDGTYKISNVPGADDDFVD